MYKFLLILPMIFLSSCFNGDNIIVDEKNTLKGYDPQGNNIVLEENITDDRKIITRTANDSFIVEDIAGNFDNKDYKFNYQFSGLSKSSSQKAQQAISELKQNNNAIRFIIYFDFNSSEIKAENTKIINDHKKFITENPELKLVLHGHTDIKGTREYNLSLGENRGLSIKNIINKLNKNINVISFGEEKTISNDDKKNRRVEFIYQ